MIKAEKITLTFAEVCYHGWDYRVWPNKTVEEWFVGDDNTDGIWISMSPYDNNYDEILEAGLKVLEVPE